MKDAIVIAKTHTITLGVVRSLGKAGYGARVLTLNKNVARIVGKSKYVRQVCVAGLSFEEIWQAMEALRGTDRFILAIPLNDDVCLMLDEHSEQLREHYAIPKLEGMPGGIKRFMDKMVQKQAAQQCGLLTAPGQSYTTDDDGIERAVREAAFPCFQKPLASANSKSGGKACFAVCTNQDELRNAMRGAEGCGCGDVLLEAYLPIEKELTAYGVAANGQVFIPACMEALRSNKGVAAEGMIRSASCLGETKEALESFVRKCGLTGLFCVDLIQCGGKLYFTEINLRSGGSGYGATLAGANLPATLANMIYGRSMEGPKDIQREVHFLNEYVELNSVMDGSITNQEYRAHMSQALERFIRSEDDPEPWKCYCRYVLIRKRLLKLLHLR